MKVHQRLRWGIFLCFLAPGPSISSWVKEQRTDPTTIINNEGIRRFVVWLIKCSSILDWREMCPFALVLRKFSYCTFFLSSNPLRIHDCEAGLSRTPTSGQACSLSLWILVPAFVLCFFMFGPDFTNLGCFQTCSFGICLATPLLAKANLSLLF